MGFQITGSGTNQGDMAHIVYSGRYQEYLHIVVRDHAGNLYPSRYAAWSTDPIIRANAVAKLQLLVDAMHLDVLQDTDQLVNDTGVPFRPERVSEDSTWFINPCVPAQDMSNIQAQDAPSAAPRNASQFTPVPDEDLPPPPSPLRAQKGTTADTQVATGGHGAESVLQDSLKVTNADDPTLQDWGGALED